MKTTQMKSVVHRCKGFTIEQQQLILACYSLKLGSNKKTIPENLHYAHVAVDMLCAPKGNTKASMYLIVPVCSSHAVDTPFAS